MNRKGKNKLTEWAEAHHFISDSTSIALTAAVQVSEALPRLLIQVTDVDIFSRDDRVWQIQEQNQKRKHFPHFNI